VSTGSITCRNLTIYGGVGSISEITATILNLGSHDLTTTNITIGYSDVATPGQYQAKIRFGTGTHVITALQGAGEYAYGYIEFEYASIAVAGSIDMRYLATVEVESTVTLVGSGNQLLYFGGTVTSTNEFGDLIIDKPSGRATMQDTWYVANFVGIQGDFDVNGFVMRVGY